MGNGGIAIKVGTSNLAGASLIQVDSRAVAELLRGPNGATYRWMIKATGLVQRAAKRYVGVNTGNLREHIVKRITVEGGNLVGYIVADTPYSAFHHEGSRAVEGKLMRWVAKDGTVVFATRRKAIPPNRFLIRAVESVRSSL